MELTRLEELLINIEQSSVIQKYMTGFQSGATYQLPITHWVESKEIEVMVESDRNVFNKFIKKICDKYKDIIKEGYYWKTDGSCPNRIYFVLK